MIYVMDDLVKLKCDYFDKNVAYVKEHMEIQEVEDNPRIIVEYYHG